MKYRKAQSSIEYLSTYAWAFVVLLVTISALSFFSVFNSDTYNFARCESGNQISCVDAYLAFNKSDMNTSLYLMFRNNYPRTIIIENVTMIDDDFVETSSQQKSLIIPSAKKATITFTNDKYFLTIGKKETFQFIITYRRFSTGQTQNYTITGQLVIETQEKGEEVETYCGDDVVNGDEECDPPITVGLHTVSGTCTSMYGELSKAYCQSDCTCGRNPYSS